MMARNKKAKAENQGQSDAVEIKEGPPAKTPPDAAAAASALEAAAPAPPKKKLPPPPKKGGPPPPAAATTAPAATNDPPMEYVLATFKCYFFSEVLNECEVGCVLSVEVCVQLFLLSSPITRHVSFLFIFFLYILRLTVGSTYRHRPLSPRLLQHRLFFRGPPLFARRAGVHQVN